MTTGEPPSYLAYMLRMWLAGTADGPVWRATLENPHTGERLAFANLEALFAFLRGQASERAHPPPAPDVPQS